MGVPTSEVCYTSAIPRREDHEVRQGHVGALGKKKEKKKIIQQIKVLNILNMVYTVHFFLFKVQFVS